MDTLSPLPALEETLKEQIRDIEKPVQTRLEEFQAQNLITRTDYLLLTEEVSASRKSILDNFRNLETEPELKEELLRRLLERYQQALDEITNKIHRRHMSHTASKRYSQLEQKLIITVEAAYSNGELLENERNHFKQLITSIFAKRSLIEVLQRTAASVLGGVIPKK